MNRHIIIQVKLSLQEYLNLLKSPQVMEAAQKFMGISLAAEKEIIYIVTKTEEKNHIMQAIAEKCGPASKSKAKAITFSLPVTDTAGLRLVED